MSAQRPLERRQLTVMLCDLVGSTAMSQRLDAEDLAALIQHYRQRCTAVIQRHGGVVAQFVGDGILAYFGYPRAHEDDAERALRAAIDIAGTAAQPAQDAGDTQVHIGIATGLVVIGDLAAASPASSAFATDANVEVSAVGSAPNLAARLQGLAGPGMIVVADATRRLTGGTFEYADLGRHTLRGFDAPVPAWQVLGESRVGGRFRALRAQALTPLVNRHAELQTLRDLWAAAQAGDGRAVLLSSEPGVGKSRLAEELASRIASDDCQRLWYYCSAHLQGTPLAPLVRQLALAAGLAASDDAARRLRKLRVLVRRAGRDAPDAVPLLASLMAVPYEPAYPALQMSAQRQKHRLFEVLLQLLAAHASRRTVLIVVEDLHWIDPSSDELIGLLIDRLQALRVLVLLTARPEFQAHWDDKPQLVHLPLTALARDDSIAMIETLCANRDIPAPTVREIAERADGLPLYIEDLTRDMLEQAGAQQDTPRGSAFLPVPATLNDALMARLDRLGSAKRVAQIGAVIGREFAYELLAKVADLSDEALREELQRLVESGLLLPGRSTDVLRHGFKHALVRDAAYASLLKREQAALHARIAKVLIDAFPERADAQPELLARHLEAADDAAGAIAYLVRAAELAAGRSGFVEAIAHLERALALAARLPDSAARTRQLLRLHVALGDVNAEYRGFSAPDCGAAYAKALDACRTLDDAPEIYAVLSRLGAFHITRAEFAQCRAVGEECLSRAVAQSLAPAQVMGHRMLGGTSMLTGRFAEARTHLEEALALYDAGARMPADGSVPGDIQDQKTSVLGYLALTLSIMGETEAGARAAHAGLAHSRVTGDPHTVNFALCFLAAALHIQGDAREALQRATESLALAREQRFATWVGISQMIRGASLVGTGRAAEGLAEILAGMNAHREMAAGAYQPFGISLLVQGLVAQQRYDDARAAIAQARAIGERTGERFYFAELARLDAEILARQGSVDEAETGLRAAIDLAREQHAHLFEARSAEVLARLALSSAAASGSP
jgi:class 3 adenylate cyclase/tetratricopeptide (TPR) repeat protein